MDDKENKFLNKENKSLNSQKVPSDLLKLVNNHVPVNEDDPEFHKLPTPVITNVEQKKIDISELMKNVGSPKVEKELKTRKQNKWFLGFCVMSGFAFSIVLLFAIFEKSKIFNFSGKEIYYENKVIKDLSEYQTAVVTDNIYTGVSVKDDNDAKELIIKDSNNQKVKCENNQTKTIETNIEKKYGIVATNLCEIDYAFAKEIESTISTIYKEFPKIKGYLTNLTLINTPEYTNYIASFSSAKLFAKSNTRNTYPNIYKMSIYLNSQYFLNPKYLQLSIEDCLSYGYFPKNATKHSIVAHEFGHYVSFIALLNNTSKMNSLLLVDKSNYSDYSKLIENSNNGVFSQKIINEAYSNYKKVSSEYKTVLKFRNSISEYAVVTDNSGEYIYDETIAEAFHDYYLNGNKAQDASKEIIKVLKKYLNK